MSTDTGQTTGQADAGKSGGRSFPRPPVRRCSPSSWSERAGRMIGGDALSSPCPSSWLARLVALPADGWLASFGACPQRSDHLIGGGFGHLDQRVPVGDLNRADVA